MAPEAFPVALKLMMIIGILLALVCGLLGLMGAGIVGSYDAGTLLVIAGWLLFAAFVTTPAAFEILMWRRLARGLPLAKMHHLATLCGSALAIFGAYAALTDRGDWFLYLPFALSGLVLLSCSFFAGWAERRNGVA